eukprot:763345-Hanusia_phi.AAC.1
MQQEHKQMVWSMLAFDALRGEKRLRGGEEERRKGGAERGERREGEIEERKKGEGDADGTPGKVET